MSRAKVAETKLNRVVKVINLFTSLWTDGDRHLPCNYRIYDKPNDGQTKNDHVTALFQRADLRGFTPECALFHSWYSSLDNLKKLRALGWHWLTRLKENRRVNPDRTGLRLISTCAIAATGTVVHLDGCGFIKVFRIDAEDCSTQYWATNQLQMDEDQRLRLADAIWWIELFFKELKSTLGFDHYRFRRFAKVERWLELVLATFFYLEWHRLRQLRRTDLTDAEKERWRRQRTYGLCLALRHDNERSDLNYVAAALQSPGGIRKLRRQLDAATKREYRASA